MLNYTNSAGYRFIWPDGSKFIEVFHKNASYDEQPVAAINADGHKREISTLKRFGNEDPDFAREW